MGDVGDLLCSCAVCAAAERGFLLIWPQVEMGSDGRLYFSLDGFDLDELG